MRALHTGSRQLDQIAGRIADTLQEMKLNQVGSPKSHRLLQDGVIDPIRALNAGPVTELRGVLQALGGGGPAGQADVEKARRLHGEVVTRMKNILEQMSQWESFVDVVNQVAEVIRMQQKVLKATEKARESRTKEVFDEASPSPQCPIPSGRSCRAVRDAVSRVFPARGHRPRTPAAPKSDKADGRLRRREAGRPRTRHRPSPPRAASPTATRSASPRRTSRPR